MRVRLSILLASLLLAGLAGCKGKAELRTKVDMRYGAVRLRPGAIAEVGEIIWRGARTRSHRGQGSRE